MLSLIKNIFAIAVIGGSFFLTSCDKVENPYPPKAEGALDASLYPGDFSTYPYPTFEANTNTLRNVFLEDFTGHKCIFCPQAADTAHALSEDFPGRVFISTIHSGPTGKEGFQSTSSEPFTYDFTNPIGLSIAKFVAGIPSSGFSGNPRGSINRKMFNNNYTSQQQQWRAASKTILEDNNLQVNLQAKLNYYPQTKGAFLHIEVDVLDESLNPEDLGMVAAIYQDSIVKPQSYPSGSGYPNNIIQTTSIRITFTVIC
jgi:hypothetical protein